MWRAAAGRKETVSVRWGRGGRTKDFCREKEEEEEKETSAELSSVHHLYGLRLDLINDRTTPEATASLSQGTKGDQRTNQRTNERTNAPRSYIYRCQRGWRIEAKTKGHRRNSRRALSTAPPTDKTAVPYCTCFPASRDTSFSCIHASKQATNFVCNLTPVAYAVLQCVTYERDLAVLETQFRQL